ncbi:hypothetical protein KUTeg_014135 [Tegillarca granosa]|uniref:Uncharacterized protein n=1 Tax=Tegillarca granosa TaxID=220873 RepID=A0ABQ9EVQ4_TEGGR|nr:hypothetical protein KUTeg_014135 [Tegillarca granosa]
MGNLPLALYTARTYMENMSIGPCIFLELMKAENIEDIESQLEEMDIQEKKLFTALKFCIYQDLKENLKPKVFEMFQMLQFLENEDIPICLLEFVYRENGYNEKVETMMMSNFLVQALQKRSLGTIEGKDENRRLSVHSSILLTLSLFTPEKEKCILLKKLIWGFSLLFDKDVFMNTDLLRMKLLIPHARAFLRHAEKMNLIADYDMLILMTFVYDLVGYGYSFGRFLTISNEYSEKCRECCYRIIGCNEEVIDASLKQSYEECDQNSVEFYEALAKRKCDVLWKKLDKMAIYHRAVIQETVQRFILQRFRSQSNMQELSRHLNIEPSDFVINASTYETLVEKDLALPFDCMTSYFLHELVLAVFYTYGRQLFYQKQKPDCKEARKLLSYLFLAKEIGQKLSEKQKTLSPLNALLSEITGVLQARVEDDAQLYQNKMEVLQETAERADTLSSLEMKYHIFGIFKMDTSVSNLFQNNCLKLAIWCFTTMLKLNIDEKTKHEVYEKGCKLADEILTRVKDLDDRRDIPGYKVRVAQFYISIENIPSEHLSQAEKLFLDVFPKDVLKKDYKRTTLEKYELQAGKGLVKCYELSDRQKEAENLKSKLDMFEL